jgi:L-ascorbate metabolism protein UlaG (beta-lactamase superfamily)
MQADRGAASRRARACHYLAGQGVEKIDPGNTGGTLYHKDFDLTFVPAWHSASHMVDGRPIYLGACCGLVVAPKQGKTVYHMGDTAIFSDMALIGGDLWPEHWIRADRRPLHDGRQDGGARLQAFL